MAQLTQQEALGILDEPIDESVDYTSLAEQETIDDLESVPSAPELPVNTESRLNYAANVALLAGGPEYLVDNYRQIDSEVKLGGRSPLAESLLGKVAQDKRVAMQPYYIEAISNPNLDPIVKRKLAQDYVMGSMTDLREELYHQALSQPSEGETNLQEDVRLGLANFGQQVLEYNQFAQDIVNSKGIDMAASQSVVGFLGESAETLIPGQAAEHVAQVKDRLAGIDPGTGSLIRNISSAYALGSSKKEIKDMINAVPIEDRKQVLASLANLTKSTGGIISGGENKWADLMLFQTFASNGDYTDAEKWFDNITGVLDIIGLGGSVRRIAQVQKASKVGQELTSVFKAGDEAGVAATLGSEANKKPLSKVLDGDVLALRDVTVVKSLKGGSQPVSYLDTIKDANPEKYRKALDLVAEDQTGEAALALGGGNRTDILGDAYLPDPVRNGDAAVASRPPLTHIDDFINTQTLAGVTPNEFMRFAIEQQNLIKAVKGVTFRQSAVQNTNEGLLVRAMYGNGDVGWHSSDQAIQETFEALKSLGVKLEDIKVSVRSGTILKPVPFSDQLRDSLKRRGISVRDGKAPRAVRGGDGKWSIELPKLDNGEFKAKWGNDADDVLAHELSHIFWSTASKPNLNKERALAKEIRQISKEFRPKAWEADAKHAGNKEEMLADGLAFLLKNPSKRKDFPNLNSLIESNDNVGFFNDFPEVNGVPTEVQEFFTHVDHVRPYRNPEEMDPLDIINNLGDIKGWAMSKDQGTLSAHINTYKSMLPAFITKSAGALVDRSSKLAKVMLKDFEAFTKPVVNLPKDRQEKVFNALKEANRTRTEPRPAQLQAQGFTPEEILAIENFRTFQDMMWRIENRDLVITSRRSGYELFVDTQGNSEYLVDPFKAGFWRGKGNQEIYDSVTDSFVVRTEQEIEQLYARGGSIDRMVSPEMHPTIGRQIDFVINNNSATAYRRQLLDNDKLLNYIPGYYSTMYDSSYFLHTVTSGANKDVRVWASAATKAEADKLQAQLSQQLGEPVHISPDMKRAEFIPPDWRVNIAKGSGRLAQKHRGQQLQTLVGNAVQTSPDNLRGPVESVLRQIDSLSNRAATREWMDNYLDRIVREYDEFLDRDPWGRPSVPNNFENIRYRRESNKSFDEDRLGDAKTAFGYYWFMRDGYSNMMDDAYKTIMNNAADSLGKGSFERLEKFARNRAEGMGPIEAARAAVFNTMIATNPIRQLPVQAFQSLQNIPILISELGKNSGRAMKDVGFMTSYILTRQMTEAGSTFTTKLNKVTSKLVGRGFTEADLEHMYKSFQESGLVASIDRHNIRAASMNQLADDTIAAKNPVMRAAKYPIDQMRKYGFDAGENVVVSSFYATHYLLALAKGKNVRSANVLMEIAGDARSYSGSFNRAGDTPYNRNWMSIALQFQQVPHKLLLQVIPERVGGDRTLTAKQKAHLAAFNIGLFGFPITAVGTLAMSPFFGDSPEELKDRDRWSKGLMGVGLNHAISWMVDDHGFENHAGIDFSSLAPWDVHGLYSIMTDSWTGGPTAVWKHMPFARVVERANDAGRISVAWAMAETQGFRYFNFDGPENEVAPGFQDVLRAWASMSSGYSNARKAMIMAESERIMSKSGATIDEQATFSKAIAQALGFQSENVANTFEVGKKIYENRTDLEADMKKDIDNFVKDMVFVQTPEEKDIILKTYEYVFSSYKGKQRELAMDLVSKKMRELTASGDIRLWNTLFTNSGLMSKDDWLNLSGKLPEPKSDAAKQMVEEQHEMIRNLDKRFLEE